MFSRLFSEMVILSQEEIKMFAILSAWTSATSLSTGDTVEELHADQLYWEILLQRRPLYLEALNLGKHKSV
jgi:hypothetical protein